MEGEPSIYPQSIAMPLRVWRCIADSRVQAYTVKLRPDGGPSSAVIEGITEASRDRRLTVRQEQYLHLVGPTMHVSSRGYGNYKSYPGKVVST